MSATANSTVAALAAVAATTTTTATVTTIATAAAAAAAAAATHNNHSSNAAIIMAAGVGNSVGGVSANAAGGMSDHLPLQLTTAKVDLDIEIDIQLLTNGYDGTTVSYYNSSPWQYTHTYMCTYSPHYRYMKSSTFLCPYAGGGIIRHTFRAMNKTIFFLFFCNFQSGIYACSCTYSSPHFLRFDARRCGSHKRVKGEFGHFYYDTFCVCFRS
ncbi:uncharacterized protein LOC128855768 [Anastrepha ludens]|uniref:uncharacterized protein LOC128855768 n=1 Tax=Anastrepha ludens TaxID=28586 RepID=UPI0023B08EBB|nr:uncharacterized protein LOC128855768 [Anastrepha ludens]